jgi:hypothetical protein
MKPCYIYLLAPMNRGSRNQKNPSKYSVVFLEEALFLKDSDSNESAHFRPPTLDNMNIRL